MAVRAPRDPAWVADGYVAERWAPTSPVTGRLDAFEWRAPSERVAQLVELEKEPKRKEVQALPPVPPPDMPAAAIEEAEVEAADEEPAEPVLEKATAAPVDGKSAEAPVEAPAEDVEPAKPVTAAKPAAKDVKASAPERREENFGPAVVAPAPVLDAEPSADEERERAAPIRLPDDPGVDGDEGAAEPRRFRLF
jgi:HemY protein